MKLFDVYGDGKGFINVDNILSIGIKDNGNYCIECKNLKFDVSRVRVDKLLLGDY